MCTYINTKDFLFIQKIERESERVSKKESELPASGSQFMHQMSAVDEAGPS